MIVCCCWFFLLKLQHMFFTLKLQYNYLCSAPTVTCTTDTPLYSACTIVGYSVD